MKNILSYWDIPLIVIVIVIAIFLWRKYRVYSKKRDEQFERESQMGISKTNSYSIFLEKKSVWSIFTIFIIGSIIFIYFRLNGNAPNFIYIIKAFIEGFISIFLP